MISSSLIFVGEPSVGKMELFGDADAYFLNDDFVLYNDCDTGGELTFAEGHIAMSQTLPTVKLGNVLAYRWDNIYNNWDTIYSAWNALHSQFH